MTGGGTFGEEELVSESESSMIIGVLEDDGRGRAEAEEEEEEEVRITGPKKLSILAFGRSLAPLRHLVWVREGREEMSRLFENFVGRGTKKIRMHVRGKNTLSKW